MGRAGQLLVLGALAVGAGLALFVRVERGAAGNPPESGAGVAGSESAGELVPAEGVADGAPDVPASLADVNRRELLVSDVPAEVERVRVAGRVVVEDASGGLHHEESGRFQFGVTVDGLVTQADVLVRRGAWSVEIPRLPGFDLTCFRASDFELGGTKAFRVDELWVDAGEAIVLHLQRLPRIKLRVLSWTGLELERFYLEAGNEPEDAGLEIPSGRRFGGHFNSERSPLELDLDLPTPEGEPAASRSWRVRRQFLTSSVIFVGAKEHAWQRIVLEPMDRELVVELAQGGALRAKLGPGLSHGPGAWLRLRREGEAGALFGERELHQDVAFECLPAGHFELLAELGPRTEPRVLARATVDVVAGVTHDVLLLPDVSSASVEIEGTLDLPHAWQLDEFELVITLASTHAAGLPAEITIPRKGMTVSVPGSSIRNWRCTLIPGSYLALVPAAGHTQPFEVEPWTRRVDVVVPPP
jgi:hypothetical protein